MKYKIAIAYQGGVVFECVTDTFLYLEGVAALISADEKLANTLYGAIIKAAVADRAAWKSELHIATGEMVLTHPDEIVMTNKPSTENQTNGPAFYSR